MYQWCLTVSIPYGLTLLSNKKLLQCWRTQSFNPLWINTTLKHIQGHTDGILGFNPLWINTTLKQKALITIREGCFNPLWINTTLKLRPSDHVRAYVSIPYGLTLLSNTSFALKELNDVSIPYGLTLLSNSLAPVVVVTVFQSPMD